MNTDLMNKLYTDLANARIALGHAIDNKHEIARHQIAVNNALETLNSVLRQQGKQEIKTNGAIRVIG